MNEACSGGDLTLVSSTVVCDESPSRLLRRLRGLLTPDRQSLQVLGRGVGFCNGFCSRRRFLRFDDGFDGDLSPTSRRAPTRRATLSTSSRLRRPAAFHECSSTVDTNSVSTTSSATGSFKFDSAAHSVFMRDDAAASSTFAARTRFSCCSRILNPLDVLGQPRFEFGELFFPNDPFVGEGMHRVLAID